MNGLACIGAEVHDDLLNLNGINGCDEESGGDGGGDVDVGGHGGAEEVDGFVEEGREGEEGWRGGLVEGEGEDLADEGLGAGGDSGDGVEGVGGGVGGRERVKGEVGVGGDDGEEIVEVMGDSPS